PSGFALGAMTRPAATSGCGTASQPIVTVLTFTENHQRENELDRTPWSISSAWLQLLGTASCFSCGLLQLLHAFANAGRISPQAPSKSIANCSIQWALCK